MGWVYMDYRNNANELHDNSIIYAHSMKNGTMFGTLKYVLDSSWRKDKENLIITFDTQKGTLKFKIFSAYKVDYTTDYMVTNFTTDREKKDFIDLITGRSSIKSDVNVGLDDKILTLSTCTGNSNRRLVVHAVLLKEGEE
jgi:sortase B